MLFPLQMKGSGFLSVFDTAENLLVAYHFLGPSAFNLLSVAGLPPLLAGRSADRITSEGDSLSSSQRPSRRSGLLVLCPAEPFASSEQKGRYR